MAAFDPQAGAIPLTGFLSSSNPKPVENLVMGLIKAKSVFYKVPIETIGALTKNLGQWVGPTPTVSTGGLNPTITDTYEIPAQRSETVGRFLSAINMDRLLMQLNKYVIGGSMSDEQEKMMIMAYNYLLNQQFFNGTDSPADPYYLPGSFVGLKTRLAAPGILGANTINKWGANTELNYNTETTLGGTIDMQPKNAAVSVIRQVGEALQTMLYGMDADDGRGVTFFANQPWIIGLTENLHQETWFKITEDNFGRQLLKFRNAEILDVGRNAPGQGSIQVTFPISTTENSDGTDTGVGKYTSIYGVKGSANNLVGIQATPFWQSENTYFPGTVQYWKAFDWPIGISLENQRAISRFSGWQVKP